MTRNQLVSTIDAIHLYTGWHAMVPSRLGHDKGVDSAAIAVASAYQCVVQPSRELLQRSYREHVEALKTLRTNLNLSDATMMTAALLAHFEGIMRSHVAAAISHWTAAVDVIFGRPTAVEHSDFAHVIAYAAYDNAFRYPVAAGLPSPFDDARWLSLDPPAQTAEAPVEALRLTRLSHQLFIRLPRLIAYMRAVRSQDASGSTIRTLELAEELMLLQHSEAENAVLHRVSIVATTDITDKAIIPFSLKYRSLAEHRAAVAYWKSRILLINLYLRLITLPAVLSFDRVPLVGLRLFETKRRTTAHDNRHSNVHPICVRPRHLRTAKSATSLHRLQGCVAGVDKVPWHTD